jgi:general secretion pathway protein L
MPILVVLIPPRARTAAAAHRAGSDEYSFVITDDGSTILNTGRCVPALLPKADSTVAALSDTDVSWHRLPIPKAPGTKLRAALAGAMEDQLLDETDTVHLALEPGATGGQDAWVCAVHKAWLQGEITKLEHSGLSVDRVVPMSWPEDTPLGHFNESSSVMATPGGTSNVHLTWSDMQGVATVQLHGSLARNLLPTWTALPARWTAHPSVASQAERWLGAPVLALRDEPRALQAMRSLWNLRQFDLAPKHRGTRALGAGWKSFLSPDWRPVRWGLAGLAALHIVGLNLWAWNLNSNINTKRDAMVQVLRDAHPQIKSVLDAPVQMQRETDTLRALSGRLGEGDLETVLGAMASAWPDGRAPLDSLSFAPGKLSMSSSGWTDEQLLQFQTSLKPAGWVVEKGTGVVTVSRAKNLGAS